MGVKPPLGDRDQTPIKRPFAHSALVSGHQENRLSLGIEREGNPPYTTARIEAQLFHVRMLRPLERIHPGARRGRPEPLDHPSLRQKLDSHFGGKRPKLRLKPGREFNGPHRHNMIYMAYAVKGICAKLKGGQIEVSTESVAFTRLKPGESLLTSKKSAAG